MAIDMAKILAAREALTQNNSFDGPSIKFWKPKDGRNRIRIMPPWTDDGFHSGSFMREAAQHWQVSPDLKGPVLCRKNTPGEEERDCPICDLVAELKEHKDDPAALELAKELQAKKTWFMSIIDLDDPEYTARDVAEFKKDRPDADIQFVAGDAKVQVFAAGVTIVQRVLGLIVENGSDITDLNKGRNLILTKSGKGMLTKYEITPDFNETAISVSTEALPDLSKVGRGLSKEDAIKRLSEGKAADYVGLYRRLAAPAAQKAALPAGVPAWVQESSPSQDDDLEAELKAALRG